MATYKYIKGISGKYLVSGPAPLGRLLNYIKRIKLGDYKTSVRGPRITDPENLDDWTVCFMVGLGLIKEPKRHPKLNIQLTDAGEKIYKLIKDLPNFPDNLGQSKSDMLKIKEEIRSEYPNLYQVLKEIFLSSPSLKNLAIFFKEKNTSYIGRQNFYKGYGALFDIDKAGFNRLPSLIQIAQFCDILIENGTKIRIYDRAYIYGSHISSATEAIKNIISQDLKREIKRKKFDEIEEEILTDLSSKTLPEKKKVIVTLFKRNVKIAKKLKNLYQGKCQICNFTFEKENGENYSETHHVIPLGEEGSEEIKNIIIVCANCHRQLHYDKARLKDLGENMRKVEINGMEKAIIYKPTHFKAIKETDIS